VTPVDWRLAEARLLDVVVGAGIGVLIGLFAWPRGGSGELQRAAGIFLADGARVVRMTVDVVADGAQPGQAVPRARRDGMLAEASFALYQSERHQPATVDWQATLVAGHHAVRGAEVLIRSCSSGGVLPPVDALTRSSLDVAARYEHVAVALLTRDRVAAAEPMPPPPDVAWPTDLGPDLYRLADLRVWLDGLREDLSRITGTAEPSITGTAEPSPAAGPSAQQARLTRVHVVR
jgi:hypothetical protein